MGSIPITRSNISSSQRLPKTLKVVLIVVGALAVGLVAAALALVLLVDPNDYKDEIVQAAKEHTGRELKVEGELKLSLFPWLGVQSGGLELANAPGFGRQPFARVNAVIVRVKLLPLLRKQVVVGTIVLDGLELNLMRNKSGASNWDDLAGGAPPTGKEPSAQGAAPAIAALSVGGIRITDGKILWLDERAGQRYAVQALTLNSGEITVDLAKQTLEISDFVLTADELRLSGAVRAHQLQGAPRLGGHVELAPFAPRALMKGLGVEYQSSGSEVLSKLGLKTDFEASDAHLALSALDATLDDSRLRGSLSIKDFAKPRYSFDLAIDQIDLDRYLPPASPPSSATPTTGAASATLPLDTLRALNAQGQLRIGELKAFGIHSAKVTAHVKAESGVITLGPNQAELYGGHYEGSTITDARGSMPKFHIKEKLRGVKIGPLLGDASISDQLTGTGDLALDVTATGLQADALLKTLSGNLLVDVRDGEVKGVDLQKELNSLLASLEKVRGQESSLKPKPTDATKYDRLTATVKLSNGIASNNDLDLRGPMLLAGKKQGGVFATGSGTADLLTQTVKYRMNVRVAESIDRGGTALPIDVTGTLAELAFQPDWRAALKARADTRLDQKKEEQKQAIEDKAEEKKQQLKDRLREKLRRK